MYKSLIPSDWFILTLFPTLVWYSCRREMRYMVNCMVGNRSLSKAVLLVGHFLRPFIVPKRRQDACYNNVQVSRVIETTDNPTIKFPPRLSWQNPAANRIVRSDRRLPNTLAIVFARRSLVVYVGVKISFQNKILTDMIRCVSRSGKILNVTLFVFS